MPSSHREQFITALYLWLDALVEGYPARTHRDQLDRIARSSTDYILPDLQRLLKHHEYEKRSSMDEVAWTQQKMQLRLFTEQREHEETRNKLEAEVTNREAAIQLAVSARTNELNAKLTAKTNAYRNLEVGCWNRFCDLQYAKCDLRELQTEYDSLSEDCIKLRHQRDAASSTSEELLGKYKALYEASKHSEEMVRELVDDGKKGIVTQQLQPYDSCIVLSPATIETICNGVKHNTSALMKHNQDLQKDIKLSRQRETLLANDIDGLQQINTILTHRLQNLEFIQTTRSNDVCKLEKEVQSKDDQVQTLLLEHAQKSAKFEDKLQCQTNQLDKAAHGTIASIAMLDDMKKSNGVLKKRVDVLQYESDALWDFLIEVDETKERWTRWITSQAGWKRAHEVAVWINESHKNYYILH